MCNPNASMIATCSGSSCEPQSELKNSILQYGHPYSHSLCLLCTLPTHHIPSIQASPCGLWHYFNTLAFTFCCPKQVQSTSMSQSALVHLHAPVYFFGQEISSEKKACPEKKERNTLSALSHTLPSSNSSAPH